MPKPLISNFLNFKSIKRLLIMNVYGLEIPDKPLTNFELLDYVKQLDIPNFRGVSMRESLPSLPHSKECGIVNFNTSAESGSHWVSYHKDRKERIYFDSYGQITLNEMQKYLKTDTGKDKQVIQRNTDIVQTLGTNIFGHLSLYVP